jgi:DNA-binding transcriptional MocR family regulator
MSDSAADLRKWLPVSTPLPGYTGKEGDNTLRLNLSYSSEERMVESIRRLGLVLEQALEG